MSGRKIEGEVKRTLPLAPDAPTRAGISERQEGKIGGHLGWSALNWLSLEK